MGNAELIDLLREPIDWAHFVNDDHAQDYAKLHRKAADALEAAERAAVERKHEIDRLRLCVNKLQEKVKLR